MIPRAADGVIVTFIFCFHSLLLTIDRDSGDGPFRHDDIGRDNGCNIGDAVLSATMTLGVTTGVTLGTALSVIIQTF